jgi:hypothetical protein
MNLHNKTIAIIGPEEMQATGHMRYSANAQDMQQAQIYIVTLPSTVEWANSTNPVHSLTGFEPFAARRVFVTDELIHQLRDEACV